MSHGDKIKHANQVRKAQLEDRVKNPVNGPITSEQHETLSRQRDAFNALLKELDGECNEFYSAGIGVDLPLEEDRAKTKDCVNNTYGTITLME